MRLLVQNKHIRTRETYRRRAQYRRLYRSGFHTWHSRNYMLRRRQNLLSRRRKLMIRQIRIQQTKKCIIHHASCRHTYLPGRNGAAFVIAKFQSTPTPLCDDVAISPMWCAEYGPARIEFITSHSGFALRMEFSRNGVDHNLLFAGSPFAPFSRRT